MSSSNKPVILCVDDEPPVCRLLSGIVREGGYEPLAVESGDAAIKALQRTKPGFDSEIADMVRAGAPISEIRQVLYRRGDYLISNHAVDKVRQLLCSPQDVFEDVLVEEVRLRPETAAAKSAKGASPGPGPANKQAVLIAEDNQDTQALLKLHLENGGYDVTIAGDGVDALLCLGKQPFALILSDLNMPNLDGFKLMEMMTQKGIGTPVIFLTAQTEEEVEQKCLELGAVDYIKKPVKKDILLMRVKKALDSHSERETVHGGLPMRPLGLPE